MEEQNTVKTSTRKRKLSSEESVVEISEDDDCVEISSQSEDVEIVGQEMKDLVSSQSTDYNLEFGSMNSQSSVEIELLNEEPVNDVKQRLLELDDEVRLLRAENEELRSNLCSCKRAGTAEQDVVLSVTFSNNQNFELYKDKLINLFKSSPDLCVTVEEAKLLLDVSKDTTIDPNEWVILDELDVRKIPKALEGSPHKKKKRKNSKSESGQGDDLFILDTTPSISTKGSRLNYESKFTVSNSSHENGKDKQVDAKPSNASACFNCGENHSLRECAAPKNYMKINAARQKFRSQQTKSVRYHLEDDQRFAHLKPGKVSAKLQRALGMCDTELPSYIYRMRQLGYPPGWFEEIQGAHQSDLVMFDFEGKREFKRKNQAQEELDAEKIIEYPGFNAPMEKGVKDEYRLYGCPSYSNEISKQSMLQFIRGIKKKAEDNLESCDMDIDNTPSDKELEPAKPSNILKPKDTTRNCTSPTLGELEFQKQKLLEELIDDPSTPAEQLNKTDASTPAEQLNKTDASTPAEQLNKTDSSTPAEQVNETDPNTPAEQLNETDPSTPPEQLNKTDSSTTAEQLNETNDTDESMGDAYRTIDITGVVEEDFDESIIETQEENGTSSPAVTVVKSSSFGTPILKSSSPYCRLPNPDNFSQNVSQVINFENLPNSTGKYEQMVGVLDKVRKTLKNLSDQKS